jgi:hypothetical protein
LPVDPPEPKRLLASASRLKRPAVASASTMTQLSENCFTLCVQDLNRETKKDLMTFLLE